MATKHATKSETKSKTAAAPNETNEERERREAAERAAQELITDLETRVDDEDVIEARVNESEEDREERRQQHIADERALADVGRVREISASLERNRANYLAQRDNAIRRLRGLAGNPVKVVHEAVMAVAKRHNIKVTPHGLTQPEPLAEPGDRSYPFAE